MIKQEILDTVAAGLKSERELRGVLPYAHAEIAAATSELIQEGRLVKDSTPSRGVIYSFPDNAVEFPLPPLEEGVPATPEEAPFPEVEDPEAESTPEAPTPEDIAELQAEDTKAKSEPEPEVEAEPKPVDPPKSKKKRWSLTSKK